MSSQRYSPELLAQSRGGLSLSIAFVMFRFLAVLTAVYYATHE